MKTQSIFFVCMLAVSFLLTQCHSHETETTKEVGTAAVKAISDKAMEAKEAGAAAATAISDKAMEAKEAGTAAAITMADKAMEAKETVQKNVAPTAESIKEKVKEGTATLAATKSDVEKKVVAVKEKAATAVKEVSKEATKPVAKKAATKPKKKGKSAIKFEALSYGFGKIKQGEIVKHDFKFKNVGNAPLVIKKVDVSCGCTFPSYPFIPIEPGKEGTIGITYDSKNKAGRQKPVITVVTNGSPRTLKLNLEGYVE